MSSRSARIALLAALLLGVAGSLLLDEGRPRLALSLWLIGSTGALWALTPQRALRGMLVAMVATAALLTGRAAENLIVMSVLLFGGGGLLVLWTAGGGPLVGAKLWDLVRLGRATIFTFVRGASALASATEEPASEGAPRGRLARALPLVAGVIIAVPVLLVVSKLLSEADPIFARGITVFTDLLAGELGEHAMRSALLAWLIAGWYAGTLAPRSSFAAPVDAPRASLSLHRPTLVGFILLLASYLGVQMRTLFGGAEFVRETAGLSLAEYARGGFFQLVVVAVLAIGVLMVVDATSQRNDERSERQFRVMGWTLIGLTALLAISAAYRMGIYVGTFGLSEDRLYAFAAMAGIVFALGWFGVTVLRGRGERLAAGLVVGAYVWVFGLHLLNPDALVARVNLSRAAAGAEFDLEYHVARSADAVPTLLRGARSLGAEQCRELVEALAKRWAAPEKDAGEWREWNFAESRATRLTRDSDPNGSCV